MILFNAIPGFFAQWFTRIKLLLFLAILSFLAFKIWSMDGFFFNQYQYLVKNIFSGRGFLLWISVLLCFANWMCEAVKWYKAASTIEPITINKAVSSVLTGQALNLLFPASMGHVMGRIINLDNQHNSKTKSATLVFVCQAIQMTVTLTGSLAGVCYLSDIITITTQWICLALIIFIALIICIAALDMNTKNSHVKLFILTIKDLNYNLLKQLFLFSWLRYLVFTAQYILVLRFLGSEQEILILASGLSLVFTAKSVMPSFHFLSDLGIREFAALLFLPLLGIPSEIVISASLYVWTINILLPSLTGAFILLKTRWNI